LSKADVSTWSVFLEVAIVNIFANVSPIWVRMFYFIAASVILVSVLLDLVLAFFVGGKVITT